MADEIKVASCMASPHQTPRFRAIVGDTILVKINGTFHEAVIAAIGSPSSVTVEWSSFSASLPTEISNSLITALVLCD